MFLSCQWVEKQVTLLLILQNQAHSDRSVLTLRSDFGLLNDVEIVKISRHGGVPLCCNCPPGQATAVLGGFSCTLLQETHPQWTC